MNMITTRRSLLKVAPAAAVAVAIPASASALAADRSAWNAAMHNMRQIEAEDAAFTPNWWATWQECKKRIDAVPHVTFEPEAYMGGRCQTTANAREVAQARSDVAALDAGKMHLDNLPGLREHYAIKRKVVEAADEREAVIQSIRDRYDMDALDEKSEQLGDAICDARESLMTMPAPDLAALRWKFEQLRDEDGDMAGWSSKYIDQTYVDIARLMPEAR